MSWDSFHIVFNRCCGIAALLTNTLMFHLICYKSPKNLGAYKYLMLYFAIFEGLYAILDMIALPDSITLRSALLTVVSSKKNHMPKELLPVLNGGFREVILNESDINIDEFDMMGFYIYPEGIKQRVNWNSVTAIIEISATVGFSETIMCVFGIKCYKKIEKLNSKKTRSNQYQSVQKQLFLALVLQTIIPLVLMYIPSGVLLFFCVTDQSFELFGRIMSTTAAVHRVLDPLLCYCRTIFCLKSNVTEGVTSGTDASSSLEMK
ncbi:hypothetical protein CRE_07026 [Caenorhabditis remanei]|uniref:G-protein coupled receptors family 1 profile domain-containing protein n=1 Tax=Caenorhabditis remanei TaxID=31234 RepID=E3NEH0_CAERE|nr:hypothetical protein CRE_07026 [Caenorhabditis remanei]